MNQPTHWHEWSPEALALAKKEDKPILLDIGAVWCHWCHVMDRESYESEEIAAILNTHFVAIKVDRDERPDVDARYQAAVAGITGQSGWPLTVFLTPEGKPFYGGSYFPSRDASGHPAFQRVLLAIAQAFREKRDELEASSQSLMNALADAEGLRESAANFSPRIVEQLAQAALLSSDRENGGFGNAPKFFHSPAIDLLIDWYASTGKAQVGKVITTTLEKMARGGVYDQLAGGFHRYSVDNRWRVPHFEKMSYDNSELLKNYVHGWQATGNPFFAEVARDILRWFREWLSDRDRGGYYGSQDADVGLDDDGDFFTWTLAEASAALSPEELAVAAAHYDIRKHGEMQHRPERNVLWVRDSVEQIAASQNRTLEATAELLASAKKKLYSARLQRPMPFIDRTLYTGWNALCISAVLQAARVLGENEEQEFALRSLDRLLSEAWQPARGLLHVTAYAEGGLSQRPAGLLDDYAFTVLACLDAYEATSTLRYLKSAEEITARMIAGFYDETSGGFFDLDITLPDEPIGALGARRKPFQDSATPAGNSAAAIALLRLHAFNGDARLHQRAEDTLKAFAGIAGQFGIAAGTYGLASTWMARAHTQVIVIGEGSDADTLYAEALAPFALNKVVLRVKNPVSPQAELPPALADTIAAAAGTTEGRAVALLCSDFACQPPIYNSNELRVALRNTIYGGRLVA